MKFDTKTQDIIRGEIIDVPNFDEFRETHGNPPKEEGEFNRSSDILSDKFAQIKESMYLDGLPVTVMSITNKGRLEFYYYHHTQDNLYPLGWVDTGLSIEQLEQLPLEEFKQIISEGMVSSKKESNGMKL